MMPTTMQMKLQGAEGGADVGVPVGELVGLVVGDAVGAAVGVVVQVVVKGQAKPSRIAFSGEAQTSTDTPSTATQYSPPFATQPSQSKLY